MLADVKSESVVIMAAMPTEHCRQLVNDWLLQRRRRQRLSLSHLSSSLEWAACCLRDAVSCFSQRMQTIERRGIRLCSEFCILSIHSLCFTETN